ncbi:unnamed protein product [Adineta ricciae]|uniref:Phospholipid-transporting ATPase n=1 Tax=Adineta ricciae TaxID=249248 RepID=A0A815IWZ8_ADIRI|nr:unnamed protein product [Adineta ricciae]
MVKLFKKKEKVEEESRKIKANDPSGNVAKQYAGNEISTSKYNLITFLPKNLFEQFRRLANAYFLFLLCLQLIPQISSLAPITTILPLVFVLALTAIKDASDDIARHRSDREVNNRETKTVVGKEFVTRKWKDIKVGDMIQLTNNEFVTADIVLISTSDDNGLCFIETAELDGETNLKVRQALEETCKIGEDIGQLSNFDGEIEYEAPNNNLGRFEGNLTWKGKTYPLKNDNIVLRGTRLRNTQWAFGIVCYAGPDTKLMKNSGKAPFKRTQIDRLLNRIILGIFFFLLIMCAIMTICSGLWESFVGYDFRMYLPWEGFLSKDRRIGAIQKSLLVFLSYIIILNTVVPISLYVSVEFIRLLQSKFIDWDIQMYYKPNNVPAQARTTTLNEELGQIEYIFSDKTGTLTQNIMTFNKCSIRGKLYGYVTDGNGNEIQDPDKTKAIEFEEKDEDFQWYDQKLIDAIKNGDEDEHNFFTLLALCHTVMPEEKDGKIIYQAQSPDENALVSAARTFGFVFDNRTQSSITVRLPDKEETYDLLNILDFNNDRKRMSVIVKKDGKIVLYCKGADSKVKERLDSSEKEIMAQTDEHLNKFATDGLRTLCLAWKDLDEGEYKKWAEKLDKANTSMENRDEKVSEVYEEIEQNLKLLGATAIEDKLQDGVPQCIEHLARAGIKIWVLTGDKVETAYNIGLSCRLLTNDMEINVIDDEDEKGVAAKLDQVRNEMIEKIEGLFDIKIQDRKKRLDWKEWGIDVMKFDQHRKNTTNNNNNNNTEQTKVTNGHPSSTTAATTANEPTSPDRESFEGFGLLITGQALVHALSDKLKMKFLELGTMCKAVVCCRVTPLQKAQVVELVMENEKKITLAIGDGANDVSMIQKAHIGVGISGQEGRQAVLASDFSFGQFCFLERLLLVHGRWSYLRISKFLRYFFYKNFAFTLCHFWFGFFSGFSAQTLYDPFFVATYNVFFSSLPVLALGVFDQDVTSEQSMNKPHLYTPGQNNEFFNKKIFAESVIHGILTSCIIFFVSYLSVSNSSRPSGMSQADLQSFGFMVATIMVVIVNLQNALEMWNWTGLYHFVLWGTIAVHFLFHFALYSPLVSTIFKTNYAYVGVAQNVLTTGNFWFTLFITCAVLLLPVFCREFFRMRFMPNKTDRARLNQRFRMEEKAAFVAHIKQKMHQPKRVVRSGYAFSQQEGWGPLITSGRMQSKATSRVRPSNITNTMSPPSTTTDNGSSHTANTPSTLHPTEVFDPIQSKKISSVSSMETEPLLSSTQNKGSRPKPSSDLISDRILADIKSYRPLRLYITKQKKKGSTENPFTLRVRYCQLPQDKQDRYLQKAVDKYIELLDEKDVDEQVQVECKLFDYLLMKGEQRKYFQSINAPVKPPGTAVPFYTQIIKEENDDDDDCDNSIPWNALNKDERKVFKRKRKEAKLEYAAQVKNFANDLPERLRADYLVYAEQYPHKRQKIHSSPVKSEDAQLIRQRRKSLTALPESLQTTEVSSPLIDDIPVKLTRNELELLHKCMPHAIYYETAVSDDDKPTFTRTMTKNSYMKSIFAQLNDEERLKYVTKSIEQWNEFLDEHPPIVEYLIPTLHLLLTRQEDMLIYFSSIGLPVRPPINSYLYYNHEKEEIGSQQTWSDLSADQKTEYTQQLNAMKHDYYEKLVDFIDNILPSDYMRYEFFRNIKYAVKDYELATKSEIVDKQTGQIQLHAYYLRKIHMQNQQEQQEQITQIKEKLFATGLTDEQKDLVEELTQVYCRYLT